MTRYHLINGVKVAFTAEEETERDNQEAAALADVAANGYKMQRSVGTATTTGYISLTEQLDQLYHDIDAGSLVLMLKLEIGLLESQVLKLPFLNHK